MKTRHTERKRLTIAEFDGDRNAAKDTFADLFSDKTGWLVNKTSLDYVMKICEEEKQNCRLKEY